eukprot:758538-Hanusia_phi.AAC.3
MRGRRFCIEARAVGCDPRGSKFHRRKSESRRVGEPRRILDLETENSEQEEVDACGPSARRARK